MLKLGICSLKENKFTKNQSEIYIFLPANFLNESFIHFVECIFLNFRADWLHARNIFGHCILLIIDK